MNISANYSNRPAFGMAFLKPESEVLGYIRGALSETTPQERDAFVRQMRNIVDGFKDCPVPVGHAIAVESNGARRYVTTMGNTRIYGSPSNSKCNEIISSMGKAVKEARDVADVDQNMGKIRNIFDIKA